MLQRPNILVSTSRLRPGQDRRLYGVAEAERLTMHHTQALPLIQTQLSHSLLAQYLQRYFE
jgi:hypothetical protein